MVQYSVDEQQISCLDHDEGLCQIASGYCHTLALTRMYIFIYRYIPCMHAVMYESVMMVMMNDDN